MKKSSKEFGILKVDPNIGEEGSLKINTNICRVHILNSRGEPVEHLPVALCSLPCHQYPSTRDIDPTSHIKDHNDEELIKWMGYNAIGTINKNLNLVKVKDTTCHNMLK